MDVIKIRDLEIYGHHGVMKEENVLGQKFLVSFIRIRGQQGKVIIWRIR